MGYERPQHDTLLDGDALRRELTALAQDARDAKLRKAALSVIKTRFSDARLCVKGDVGSGAWDGERAAQALSLEEAAGDDADLLGPHPARSGGEVTGPLSTHAQVPSMSVRAAFSAAVHSERGRLPQIAIS